MSGTTFTLNYVAEVFRNPIYIEGLRNALFIAIGSTLASFALAMPLAWLGDRYDFAGKKTLSALLLAPDDPAAVRRGYRRQENSRPGRQRQRPPTRSPPARAPDRTIDWLGQNRFWGVVALNSLHLYPILYLNIAAALANIDPAMEEAAENLGSTGFRKFFKITLPLIAPGVFAGGTIVFIWGFTELGVPLIFDYTRVTSVQIFYGIKDIGNNPFPYALVAVMLVATMLLYTISRVTFGRKAQGLTMMAKATSRGGPRKVSGRAAWLCVGAFGLVIFLAMLPHVGVVLVAFSRDWYGTILPASWTTENFQTALGHSLTVPSIGNSLRYAAVSTVVDAVLGVAIAYVVVRTTMPGRQILDAVAMLPLAVPGLVLAFGYLAITQEGQPLSFLNPVRNPVPLLIIAYSVRRLPYMVRSRGGGVSADERDAGGSRAEPRLSAVAHAVPGDDAAHRRELTRRRVADVLVCDAGGQRFAVAGTEAGILPDHEGDLRIVQPAGHGPGGGERVGRVGDGVLGRDDPRGERAAGEEDGGVVPGIAIGAQNHGSAETQERWRLFIRQL